MIRRKSGNSRLVLISTLSSLILAELILSFMVQESDASSGVLFGIELPPMKPIPPGYSAPDAEEIERRAAQWYESLIVGEKKITFGDLHGIMREDEFTGYAPLENSVSVNGWWQTNELGARSQGAIVGKIPESGERAIFFGDSYTQASRVPNEETFAFFLDKRLARTEVVNFGVDGYSIGQAFLRYQSLQDKLEYDRVFLVCVPEADLWREINVLRHIARDWESYMVNPRFVFENGQLQHVPSPYSDLQELLNDNRTGLSERLRRHLQQYDSFYFKSRFESRPILDYSIIFRLVKRAWGQHQYSKLMKNLKDVGSEAMQVTLETAKSMERVVTAQNAQFSFIILPGPGDVELYLTNSQYRDEWNDMAKFLCGALNDCHDLMVDFVKAPPERFDGGYDGSHYGPSANRLIAEILAERVFH